VNLEILQLLRELTLITQLLFQSKFKSNKKRHLSQLQTRTERYTLGVRIIMGSLAMAILNQGLCLN